MGYGQQNPQEYLSLRSDLPKIVLSTIWAVSKATHDNTFAGWHCVIWLEWSCQKYNSDYNIDWYLQLSYQIYPATHDQSPTTCYSPHRIDYLPYATFLMPRSVWFLPFTKSLDPVYCIIYWSISWYEIASILALESIYGLVESGWLEVYHWLQVWGKFSPRLEVMLTTGPDNPPEVQVWTGKTVRTVPEPSKNLTLCFLADQPRPFTHPPARFAGFG